MKASEIVQQLRAVIPRYSNLFSDEVIVDSLTCAGSLVTAVTATPHGLETDNQINIVDAITPISITSLTILNGNGVATTLTDHDLTLGYQQTITIGGADQPEYNGTFELLEVPNRFNFVFKFTTIPTIPATGTPALLTMYKQGYNGLQSVTVIDETTFTYPITAIVESPAQGEIVLRKSARISSAINIERFIEAYTPHLDNQLWLVVCLGETTASKDRFVYSDATYSHTSGQDFRQRMLSPFSVYVLIPTETSLSASVARDLAEDVAKLIFRAILRFSVPSIFTDQTNFGITSAGHNSYQYPYAFYVHEYRFDTNYDITYQDTVDTDDSRAFRDIDLQFKSYFNGLEMMTSNINLDVDPDFSS